MTSLTLSVRSALPAGQYPRAAATGPFVVGGRMSADLLPLRG